MKENKKENMQFIREDARREYHGWLLYDSTDQGRNPHYTDLYRAACKKYGMSVELGLCRPGSACSSLGRQQLIEFAEAERPAYVINRTRDYRLAKLLESLKIPVFNSSGITKLGNDKAEAYRYMCRRGIPVMPTVYDAAEAPKCYPAVVKSSHGHGGTEVYLIRSESEWMDWKHGICQAKEDYVIQQAASDAGKDVRVYVVGGRIAAAVLRTSEKDFRSNYCLGGNVSLYELTYKERELVKKTMEGLSIGMAGIDFIFHRGEMVFNELEDVAGARGLYTLTDYNIVEAYIDYIWEELRRGRAGKTEDL